MADRFDRFSPFYDEYSPGYSWTDVPNRWGDIINTAKQKTKLEKANEPVQRNTEYDLGPIALKESFTPTNEDTKFYILLLLIVIVFCMTYKNMMSVQKLLGAIKRLDDRKT